MKAYGVFLVALVLGLAAPAAGAKDAKLDPITKAFHDGGFLPRVYEESVILRRYGKGDWRVDEVGLLRRRYFDPSTGWEIVITSSPDVAPTFRTIDEIRVSPVVTGAPARRHTESLKGLRLKGVAIGDSRSKATAASVRFGHMYTRKDKLGDLEVERVCGYDDGLSICFDIREEKVIAIAVGAGP